MTELKPEALANLTERERRIIELRYGLSDGEMHTYEEIATAFELTPERVRQLEKNALSQLGRR